MTSDPLLGALLAGREEVADRILRRARAEMPSFAGVPVEEHREDVRDAVALLVEMRRAEQVGERSEGEAALRELGERRARQGVPVEDVLRSWRMGIEEATAYAREVAPRIDAGEGDVFDLFTQAFALVDDAMVSIATGHRADPGEAGPETGRRESLVRGVLLGRLSAEEVQSGCAALALDPLASFRPFRAREVEQETLERLDAALAPAGGGRRSGLAALLGHELAGFACEPLPRGMLPLVAIGPAAPIGELSSSYLTAGRVLAAAEAFGLAGIHDLASAGLHAAVLEDSELGEALAERLVAPVRELPSGEEILAGTRAWLAAGMRVAPAAERLFIHPNTLRYRLRRYQEATGADLGETEDAFRAWWALQREAALAESATAS